MGSGTDVALEAADAAVLNNRVSDVAALVRLSRRTLSIIRENVTIALGLKAVFLRHHRHGHDRPVDRHSGRYRRHRAGDRQCAEAAQSAVGLPLIP